MKIERAFPLELLLLVLIPGCQVSRPTAPPISAPQAATAAPGAPLATYTPISTPTQTPAQLLAPFTIEGLRQHVFVQGEIKVLSLARTTSIYKRYLISYPSDGLTITGVMQVPVEGHAPFPVIVMNHGYFNREEYQPGDGTDRAAEYLNKHGYLTLASDYRSWGGSDIGPSLYYSGLAIDVASLIHAVCSIPEADPSRIGMWGHSMGGGVTMKVLMLDTPVKAAVLYSTVSADDADVLARWGLGCIGDIIAGEHQLGCNSSDVVPLDLAPDLIQAYYEASMDAGQLRAFSPIDHLEFVSVPVEINFGTNDGKTSAGTPPEWSRKLYQALKDAGKSAELFSYEGELHSFNGDNWIAFMERSAHFFDDYVKARKP